MSDDLKNAIFALQNGESSSFKDAIRDTLMAKAVDAIELEKIIAGEKFFNPAEDQEADDDEEI